MFHVLATLVMMLTPLQLPSVHHNPSCDNAEEKKKNVKRGFSQQK